MFWAEEELNREPRKGIVGIDLRMVPREMGRRALLYEAGRARVVVLETV